MKEIRGESKTIRQLLSGAKYSIDFYQREYKWQGKHVSELLDDFEEKFFADYKKSDERSAVQAYGHYFLGSIILSKKQGQTFIIDGQQRLTTLTLLLIYLHNRQGQRIDRVKVEDLIYSEKYGKKSFNIDVDERYDCVNALFTRKAYEADTDSESIRNIRARFAEIGEHLTAEIDNDALPYFVDWLIENVHLVEITASSDEDAYTIFETMNDRGLSLNPLDMLKGYVLSRIDDRERMNSPGDGDVIK